MTIISQFSFCISITFSVILLLSSFIDTFVSATPTRRNVLLIMSDDMRPNIGAYGSFNMTTPNIDRLATRSLVARRAYVQQAVCSPSRTSMLTGRRPDTTRVHDLTQYWRDVAGNFTTLPQYFKENGYKTAGLGKVDFVGLLLLLFLPPGTQSHKS